MNNIKKIKSTIKPILALCGLILLSSNCLQKQPEHSQVFVNTHVEDKPIILDDVLKTPLQDMTFNQAECAKDYYEKENKTDLVIKCAERMVTLATDQEKTGQTLLQLAQIYLDEGDLEKAQKHAGDYEILYPGTKEAQDAAYIQTKASFLSALSPDRDQTATNKTLELAQNFLETYKDDNKYEKSIKDMVDNCYIKLIDSEIGIANTYLAKYNYSERAASLKAAEQRLAYIREKLLPYTVSQEPRILEMEIKLAQAGKEQSIINEKEQELSKKYPQYAFKNSNDNLSLVERIKRVTRKF